MNIKRYVNGKPVGEKEFKSLEIRSKSTSRIMSDIFEKLNTSNSDELNNVRKQF